MSDSSRQVNPIVPASVGSNPSKRLACRLLVCWIFAAIFGSVLVHSMEASIVNFAIVSIASGMLGWFAMRPMLKALAANLRGQPSGVGLISSDSNPEYVRAIFSGMTIRLVGTVALFLSCRYHMGSTNEMIAAMTIFWYGFLTFVEVVLMSLEFARFLTVPCTNDTQTMQTGEDWLGSNRELA